MTLIIVTDPRLFYAPASQNGFIGLKASGCLGNDGSARCSPNLIALAIAAAFRLQRQDQVVWDEPVSDTSAGARSFDDDPDVP